MKVLLMASLALAACEQDSVPEKPRTFDSGTFLRDAVVQGLKEDGADRNFVQESLTGQDLFVLKCPVCEPVRKGFIEYGYAKSAQNPPIGPGIPKDVVDELKKPDRLARLKAVERLVDRYVSRHYDRLKMTGEERRKMRAVLEDGKKEGMGLKEMGPNKGLFDFCPSCNGAAKAK